jgi:hypothetical protein
MGSVSIKLRDTRVGTNTIDCAGEGTKDQRYNEYSSTKREVDFTY